MRHIVRCDPGAGWRSRPGTGWPSHRSRTSACGAWDGSREGGREGTSHFAEGPTIDTSGSSPFSICGPPYAPHASRNGGSSFQTSMMRSWPGSRPWSDASFGSITASRSGGRSGLSFSWWDPSSTCTAVGMLEALRHLLGRSGRPTSGPWSRPRLWPLHPAPVTFSRPFWPPQARRSPHQADVLRRSCCRSASGRGPARRAGSSPRWRGAPERMRIRADNRERSG